MFVLILQLLLALLEGLRDRRQVPGDPLSHWEYQGGYRRRDGRWVRGHYRRR